MNTSIGFRVAAASALIALGALAQQKVPFAGGIPVAPKGLAGKKLPEKPVVYDTGEGQRIKVSVVTKALETPFGATFLPDGTMLVTERTAKLRVIRSGVLDPKPVTGGPVGFGTGESGLPGAVHGYMDVVLHPQFADNHYVYISYSKPLDGNKRVAAISRSKWDGKALTETKDIFVAEGEGPTRLAFDRNGFLYATISGQDPQSLST